MGEPKKLHPLTPQTLLSCVAHVDYEVAMLLGLLELQVDRAPKPHDFSRPETLHYLSRLEALVAHIRVLDEFLCGPFGKSYEDDLFARHYVPAWTSVPVIDTQARDRANKQLAHLTTTRATKQEGWEFRTLVTKLARELLRFVDTLEPGSNFAIAFEQTRERLASFLKTPGHPGHPSRPHLASTLTESASNGS